MYYLSWSVVKARWISLEKALWFILFYTFALQHQVYSKRRHRALKYICKTVIDRMFLQDGVWKAEVFITVIRFIRGHVSLFHMKLNA